MKRNTYLYKAVSRVSGKPHLVRDMGLWKCVCTIGEAHVRLGLPAWADEPKRAYKVWRNELPWRRRKRFFEVRQ